MKLRAMLFPLIITLFWGCEEGPLSPVYHGQSIVLSADLCDYYTSSGECVVEADPINASYKQIECIVCDSNATTGGSTSDDGTTSDGGGGTTDGGDDGSSSNISDYTYVTCGDGPTHIAILGKTVTGDQMTFTSSYEAETACSHIVHDIFHMMKQEFLSPSGDALTDPVELDPQHSPSNVSGFRTQFDQPVLVKGYTTFDIKGTTDHRINFLDHQLGDRATFISNAYKTVQ